MPSRPFEVYVRHGRRESRKVLLPYPLHAWHLADHGGDEGPVENFRPSEYDRVDLVLRRTSPCGEIGLIVEGTPLFVVLPPDELEASIEAWAPLDDETDDSTTGKGLWGRAGVYRLRVQIGTTSWMTSIEVQPHYLTFDELGTMCAQIERLSTWVAYDILPYAPIMHAHLARLAQLEGDDGDPAILFARLKETIPETLRVLRSLSVSPQHSLTSTYESSRAGTSRRQDRRALRLEERLEAREEGWIVQRSGEVNYDIYENRFLKRLVLDLQRRLGQLQDRMMDALYELERQEDEVRRRLRRQFGDQPDRIRREEPVWTRPIRSRMAGLRSQIAACSRMRDALRSVLESGMLRNVPALQGIVRPTNVLQFDPKYSRLWSIYRLLVNADRAETSQAFRFHRRSRPSAELYEMWTAVEVMQACMRDLRFTRLIYQTVADQSDEGLVYMYDTPRPAVIRLEHESEPIVVEVTYGGFIPMSEHALMSRASKGPQTEDVPAVDPLRADSEAEPAPDLNGSPEGPLFDADEIEAIEATGAWSNTAELVTRGVQTAPDLLVSFYEAQSDELLGLIILDAKYKGGRRIWWREGGRPTDDRLALESYLLDIHRRGRQKSAALLYSQPADDIVLGAYALFPGERYGWELSLEDRVSADGRLGALRVAPSEIPSEELMHVLLDALGQVQLRRLRKLDENSSASTLEPSEPVIGDRNPEPDART